MSYFTGSSWINSDYRIRRALTFNPIELQPGSEHRLGVQLPLVTIVPKLKSDYSDVIVYESTTARPSYTIVDEDYFTVIFTTSSKITTTDIDHSLYYYHKAEARQPSDSLNLNVETLDGSSKPEEDNTRWALTNPTIDWVNNVSQKKDARATFIFTGHRADIFFKSGPDYGQFAYSLDGGAETTIDCYAETESTNALISVNKNKVEKTTIRIRALETKSPYSSGTGVELVRADYNEVLLASYGIEEFESNRGYSVILGNN